MAHGVEIEAPVIEDVAAFDRHSGSILERLLFNNRPIILLVCLFLTVVLGFEATKIRLNASFEQMIPTHQQFIVNYFKHYEELQGQGNEIRIAVAANRGTILNAHYLNVLQHVNDDAFLLPGVDRAFMTSLWTPNSRWIAVTPDGLTGGPIITQDYDGSPAQLQIVAKNILNSGQIGSLVSPDYKSSMITIPLLDHDNVTGKALDYGDLGRQLDALRAKYAAQGVTLHITGYAMIVGDLINGIATILGFFLASVAIATAMLFWYTRCVRSTGLVVVSSLIAVTWQLGLLPLLGYDLNPYSVLVPFLIFAIGMSHGAQKMNGVMQDIGRGTHPLVAARYTFRRLFMAGFAALTCDVVSFAVLLTIKIEAIRQLALIASIGVAILIFTNLIMLPMLLSYTGVSAKAARRSMQAETDGQPHAAASALWKFLDLFTVRRYALIALVCAFVLGAFGWFVGRNVQVGDLNQGAPELRANSLYNQDNAYIASHYSIGNDNFVVMVDTPKYQCNSYPIVSMMDDLEWRLQQLPQVESTSSIGTASRQMAMLLTEDSDKWFEVSGNQYFLDDIFPNLPSSLVTMDCNFLPLYVSLTDHRAKTLDSVVKLVEAFRDKPENQIPGVSISLAGGNAGIEAATNIVIEHANAEMLYLVYAAVTLFCLVAFRSWRAVICAVLPLILTSILGQAIMVWLGIGIKVATLPVIALGVGIGVDYALYVLSIVLKHLRQGESLSTAYYRTLNFTGKVVLLTGFTLATGVATWVFAPIKFQADMGLLLSFMFLWNMLGALVLLPALAYFLLPVSLFQQTAKEAVQHRSRQVRKGAEVNGKEMTECLPAENVVPLPK